MWLMVEFWSDRDCDLVLQDTKAKYNFRKAIAEDCGRSTLFDPFLK